MNVLKGHYNLAQGKRSVALGRKMGIIIVRETKLIKRVHPFGRKGMNSNSVRKEFFSLISIFQQTVFFYSFRCLGLEYAGLSGRNMVCEGLIRLRTYG
jgi:hypothetical protein